MSQPTTRDSSISQLSRLTKRANAAVIDMAVVGVICFGFQWSMRLSDPPRHNAGVVFGVLLGSLLLIEVLTGRTVGKQMCSLAVQTKSGARPPVYALFVRGTVRELPVFVFLPSVYIQNGLTSLLIWGISLTLICCYVATAYLTLVRVERSPFDLVGKTVVIDVRREGSPESSA